MPFAGEWNIDRLEISQHQGIVLFLCVLFSWINLSPLGRRWEAQIYEGIPTQWGWRFAMTLRREYSSTSRRE